MTLTCPNCGNARNFQVKTLQVHVVRLEDARVDVQEEQRPAVLELLPSARVGHIGLQRDEATAIASRYYSKLPPKMAESFVLMIDPMLATGGSAAAAIDLIKAAGARTIRMICIVSAPDGVALLEKQHPDVVIYTPVIDRELNPHKFIVPGLGDFGDRLYGTV